MNTTVTLNFVIDEEALKKVEARIREDIARRNIVNTPAKTRAKRSSKSGR